MNPVVAGDNAITMSANEGTDAGGNGVFYYFRCVNDSARDSGWISESCYTDCNCAAGTTYTYAVKMKDKLGNTGTESTQLSATTPAVDTTAPTPNPPTFSSAPKGTSTTSISMTATKGVDTDETVMYKFNRMSPTVATSGWTSSRTWTDTGLTSGTTYYYNLQMKDSHGNTTSTSTSASAVARDDTAPVMDPDSRMQFGTHPYVQLDKTIRMYCQNQAETNVQYYYECVEQPSINSGWITTTEWITPPMANGTYNFRFRMRDTSPQPNVSDWSAAKSATVTTTNSYQDYTLSQLASLPDDTLVRFNGTVIQVNPTYYVVSDGTNTINVTPRAFRSLTEPMMINQNVTVKGHLWTYTGSPKCVTFAVVAGNPRAGKIEFEDCDSLAERYPVMYDAAASHSEFMGGWAHGAGWEMSLSNVAAANQITLCYNSYGGPAGTISMYVNGVHSTDITLPYSATYTTVKKTGLAIPAGATLMFRHDSGDIDPALDYLILANYTISGKVSNAGGTGIAGATVYFSATANASTTYSITTTTDASGNYTQGMPNGTWYVAVSHPSYNTSADRVVTVNNASVPNTNFTMIANAVISGKVTKQSDGTPIAGATVYFTQSPTTVATYSTTTDASGNYSQSVQNGVWYVCAAATGYKAAPNQLLNVSGANIPGINFSLSTLVRNIPRTSDLLFGVITESLPASGPTGPWPAYYPSGQSLTTYDNPTAITLNGIKWEVNDTTSNGDGFYFGSFSTLAVNGGTIVAVCKPKRLNDIGGFQDLVNVMCDQFALAISRSSGAVTVTRRGQGYGGISIPDGQETIISVVVQPTGEIKVYTNGDQVMNITDTSPFTNLVAQANDWRSEINIGRYNSIDGWSTYQGQIGDVFVYKVALSDAERVQLESDLGQKFGIGVPVAITASAGTGGTISPSGTAAYRHGTDQTFTITPSPGYGVSQVTVDGVNQGAITSYTFLYLQTDHTISATFVTVPNKTITASAGTGGTITPSGAVWVLYNGTQTFTISRNSGYAISQVTVDGVNQGAIASYTFTNVQANHTISATFVPVPTYTITASAGVNGTISPSGSVVVDQGSSQTFTITPNTGYIVSAVTVDGSSAGALTTYTFTNVQAAHTISATFVQSTLPSGTVGYWPFDNTLNDGSANGNTLKGTSGTLAYGPAKFGSASLYLDGSTTLGTLSGSFPTGVPTGNNAYTVACFVKADPTSQGNGGWLGYGSPGYSNGTLSMNFRMAGYYASNVYWWNNDQGGTIPNGGDFRTAWHSVVATYNGATRIIYIDGQNVAQGTPSAPANVSNSQFVVGKTLGDVNLKGWIDDLLIVNRALSAAEAASYNTNGANVAATQYTITVSAGAGGTITPSGPVITVNSGANQSFTIAANSGYATTQVTVDGVNKGAITSHQFTNVTASHIISATFVKPLGVNNRTVLTDNKLVGRVVRVWGKVKSTGSGTFQISDGHSVNVTITGSTAGLDTSKTVVITGTLNADKSVTAQTIQIF